MKIKKINYLYIFLLFVCLLPISLKSQISIGGIPPSFEYNLSKSAIQTLNIDKPDVSQLLLEDEISAQKGEAYRMGLLLPVNKGIHDAGTWTTLRNGDKIWQLRITAKAALATSLYYDKFYLPKGSRLFVYNDDRTQLIGAFTYKNNHSSGYFATELIAGDACILEYYEAFNVKDSVNIHISEINYAYRGVSISSNLKYGFGASGSCEVNVNCSEGNNWQLQKAGVARINIRVSGSSKWCTGSLVNNTLQNYKPYLLTADHCGVNASATDITQWMFYFNYEAAGCSQPSSEGTLASQSMTGAVKIANGGNAGNTGSDFLLLLLNNNVPDTYNPYFIGWDRSGDSSLSGVSIHHPAGDIKKISTYTTPLQTSAYNVALSHWKVYWDSTANGHGVTEGGSSGSPIFNTSGKLIGTLTGGTSDCSQLNESDFYGKFDWHWDKDGATAVEHLKEWLDPIASNVMQLGGITYNKADFIANTTLVKLGEAVNFTNKSIGGPYNYLWVFDAALPATSTLENPGEIKYITTGLFDVSLKASNSDTSFSATKQNYIRVWNDVKIYNTQSAGQLWINFNNNVISEYSITIFDVMGRRQFYTAQTNAIQNLFSINLTNLNSGVYFVKLKTNQAEYDKKIVIVR
ncbi:MAG: T9SS type A sorting domain-containing protein [Bacteroidota bacterium]